MVAMRGCVTEKIYGEYCRFILSINKDKKLMERNSLFWFYISIALMAALLIRLRFFLILLLGRAGSLGFTGGGRGRMVVDDVAVTKVTTNGHQNIYFTLVLQTLF